ADHAAPPGTGGAGPARPGGPAPHDGRRDGPERDGRAGAEASVKDRGSRGGSSAKLMPAPDALDVAVKALARRDLSEHEVVERLTRLGVPEDSRAGAVARLRQAGYLDDARVAAERAARLADRGSGDTAIQAEPMRRGVPPELVTQTTA